LRALRLGVRKKDSRNGAKVAKTCAPLTHSMHPALSDPRTCAKCETFVLFVVKLKFLVAALRPRQDKSRLCNREVTNAAK
jgi:hypothetical protein